LPSPLEQLLSAGDLRDVGMDQLKRRMLMQLLLQNPVAEGNVDHTSPYYASSAMKMGGNQQDAYGGILPDRSGGTGMVYEPGKGALRIAPSDARAQELKAKLKAPQDIY
jgi:hypothetical protein